MDILCTRCGEPWDISSLVMDMLPEEADKLKAGKGCPCCYSKEPCLKDLNCDECSKYQNYICLVNRFKPINNDARYIQRELAGILGDDTDGLASTMEDFGLI